MTAARVAAAALARFGEAPDESFAADLDAAQLDAFARLNERSVCRDYDPDRPVAPALLRLLIATALASPSKSDLQQANILELRDPARRSAVTGPLLSRSGWIATAPVFLVFLADGRRFQHIFARRATPMANDHMDQLFNATVDSAITLGAFVQAATLAGLGCCPISEVRNHATAVADALDLPPRVFPVAGMCVGWPKRLEPRSPRLGLAATAPVDRVGDDLDELDAQLGEYDARRRATRPYLRQREPERFGEDPAYSWTEEKRRHYANPQRADFGDFLRARGFRF